MDEELFRRWADFWEREPFGPSVDHLMQARIASSFGGGNEADLLPYPKE